MSKNILFALCCLVFAGSNASPCIPRPLPAFSQAPCRFAQADPIINCTFYHACIDNIFPCGTRGLALGYAIPRCDRLLRLKHSEAKCPNCIQNQAILDWVQLSEKCLQTQLLNLAQNQDTNRLPDPPDCLNFECYGLNILGQCYSQSDVICQLINHVSFDVLESDLKEVLNAAVVNSYYESMVIQQFRGFLSSCNHSQASSLADKVAPPTESILLCASLMVWNPQLGLTLTTAENLTLELSKKLNQASTDFKVASYDPSTSANCQEKSQSAWNVDSFEYYLVYWTLSAGANKTALTLCRDSEACVNFDTLTVLVYFEYTNLTTSSCGNGLQEAGETCDLFVFNGLEDYGCSDQCRVIPGYECTTRHLQQSFCNKTVCGDGRRTSDEECDEGAGSEACHAEWCTIAEGYTCEVPYNATSHCTTCSFHP